MGCVVREKILKINKRAAEYYHGSNNTRAGELSRSVIRSFMTLQQINLLLFERKVP